MTKKMKDDKDFYEELNRINRWSICISLVAIVISIVTIVLKSIR